MLQIPRSVLAPACLALALVLAGCGSRLDPQTVAQVGGTGAAAGRPPTAATAAGPDGSVPGTSGGTGDGAGGGSGTTAGGGSSAGGGSGGGDTPQGSGDNAAAGGAKAGNCAGFKNQTGITDDAISLGNASDISGPVPGLFESAQEGARAYVAYFNSTSDICGRKLDLKSYDSRTDAAADQQAYAKGCDETFAMVGSMSAFDSGGASTAQGCGLPDIRTAATTADRLDCTTCFAAEAANSQRVPERRARLRPQELRRRRPARRDALHQRRCGRRERQDAGRRDGQAWHALRLRPGHRHLGVQLRALRAADEGQGHRVRPDDRVDGPVHPARRRHEAAGVQAQGLHASTRRRTTPTTSAAAATPSTARRSSSTSRPSRRPAATRSCSSTSAGSSR